MSQKRPEITVLDTPDTAVKVNAESFPYGNLRFTCQHPKLPQVTVGPVIGTVTQTTARILVEASVNATLTVTAIARVRKRELRTQKTQAFVGGIPGVVFLTDLRPDTEYTVFVNLPTPNLIRSSFRTRPRRGALGDSLEASHLRVAFVAGHTSFQRHASEQRVRRAQRRGPLPPGDILKYAEQLAENREKSQRASRELWKDLYKKVIAHQIDMLVHLGNIPYACGSAVATGAEETRAETEKRLSAVLDTFEIALLAIVTIPRPAEAFQVACEVFRTMYRVAWNGPYTKHVLANISNYMVMNEAEIGRWKGEKEGTSEERFVASCAYEVYNEYVRNLSHDYVPYSMPRATVPLAVHMSHELNDDVAMILLDLKACKALRFTSEKQGDKPRRILPQLGILQWADIFEGLCPGGWLEHKKCLIVSTQQRLSDPHSMWYMEPYKAETYHLLRRLFHWRNQRPFGHRAILLVASDTPEGEPSCGVADILIDHHRFTLDDPRHDRLREVCFSGMGLLSCLDDVPSLNRPRPVQAFPTSKPTTIAPFRSRFHELTDLATLQKPEGGIMNSVSRLRQPKLSKTNVRLRSLGEEFLALQYQTAEINCYALATIEGQYTVTEDHERDVPNAKASLWKNYVVRPAITTQIIGAEFNVGTSPPAAGIMVFQPVKDTQTRSLQKDALCCCKATTCDCMPSWVVR